MAGMFGVLVVWDHPFMVFPLEDDAKLYLPCGTIPTCLIEKEGSTLIQVGTARGGMLTWAATLSAEEVQAVFREGAKKLNRVADAPEAIPLKP